MKIAPVYLNETFQFEIKNIQIYFPVYVSVILIASSQMLFCIWLWFSGADSLPPTASSAL